MPTQPQKELFKELIGKKGIYFLEILNTNEIPLATKILYLERALEPNQIIFFAYLDRLFTTPKTPQNAASRLDVTLAFKIIHDLLHNNEVSYEDWGIRPAYQHYFKALVTKDEKKFTQTIDVEAFKAFARTLVTQHLEFLKQAQPLSEVVESKREETKKAHAADYTWRMHASLPRAYTLVFPDRPASPTRRISFYVRVPLSPSTTQAGRPTSEAIGESQSLSHELLAPTLILEGSSSYLESPTSPIARVSSHRSIFFETDIPREVRPLIEQNYCTRQEVLRFKPEELHKLSSLTPLILKRHITVSRASKLTNPEFNKIIAMLPLITHEKLSIDRALTLKARECQILSQGNIVKLITEAYIDSNKILRQPDAQIQRLTCLQPLISKQMLTVRDALLFSEDEFFNFKQETVFSRVELGSLSIEKAKKLSRTEVEEIEKEELAEQDYAVAVKPC